MRILVILFGGLLACSCSLNHQQQMEKVAKDWAITIRASQVIPVYPMTEDLEPGDVFIVTTPLSDQRQDWNERGYMPLPNHVARIHGLDYDSFYAGSFGSADGRRMPHWWRTVREEPSLGTAETAEGEEAHNAATNWRDAPRAFFPTYAFEVESGIGLAAAFPVYGVPVGMSLMGAKRASGSVTIRDAYTYGVSLQELRGGLSAWLDEPGTRGMLRTLRDTAADNEVYVRVIYRVFLTGSVAIVVNNEDSFGAGLDVGAPKDTADPFSEDPEQYVERLDMINERVNAAMPGGSLSVTHATRRSITAVEQFDRPLVIGYLAFDFAVLQDGGLSEAMSTLNMLRRDERPIGLFTGPTPIQEENAAFLAEYKSKHDDVALGVLDRVATILGGEFLEIYTETKTAEMEAGATELGAARAAIQEGYDNTVGEDFPRRFNSAFKSALAD